MLAQEQTSKNRLQVKKKKKVEFRRRSLLEEQTQEV